MLTNYRHWLAGYLTSVSGTAPVVVTGSVISMKKASATDSGWVDNIAQTFAGVKTFTSNPTLSAMTAGSIPYIGTGGAIRQNNSGLFWDSTNARLSIGTVTPTNQLSIISNVAASAATGLFITNNHASGYSNITISNNNANNVQIYIQGSSGAVPNMLRFYNPSTTGFQFSEKIGIGTSGAANYKLEVNGTSGFTGNMVMTADNTYDLGASGATRPRTGYFGTSVVSPVLTAATSVTTGKYYVSAMNTVPSSAADTGTLGEIRVTATYIYVCTATNTWVRTALATW